ncbi:MAG: ribosome silencing factor [Gemmatimonadaceae bacterium]
MTPPEIIAEQARRAAALCLDFKADDVLLLDLHGVTDMADYFIVATGTSDTHVRSVAGNIVEAMAKSGVQAHHVEGIEQGRWVLVDFVDFVLHVFHPTMRAYYQIERLWGDAPAVAITS